MGCLDTVVLSSSFGRDMATTCGYARTVRLWWRGTGADQAPVIFDIAADLMAEPIATSTIP